MAKAKPKVKAEPNPDNMIRILEEWLQVKKGNISEEDFYLKVREWRNNKEVDDADILAIQHDIGMGNFLELTCYLTKSPETGMYFVDARTIAQKYHFMLLSTIQKNKGKDMIAIEQSFRAYENMIETIFHGKLDKAKVDLLDSLPSTSAWDHDLACVKHEEYHKL